MCRPFRRYCFGLAERLGVLHPRMLYQILSVDEIMEWMAYDKSIDPDYIKSYKAELEVERTKELDIEERCRLIKQMLGG